MAMRRRRFLSVLVHGGIVLAAPIGWLTKRTIPVRVTEAWRARRGPGRVVEINSESVKRPGRWAG